METELEELKKQAAEKAVEYVRDGMILGLGTGSTTHFAIQKIAELWNNKIFKNILCIPSSIATEKEAHFSKLPLTSLNDHPIIDLTIDGADEVDSQLNLIKGGGGALLREKILAQSSKQVIIIIDETKLSPQLGTNWAVPVEVIEFGRRSAINYLESLGAKVTIRSAKDGKLFKSDEGNLILDCEFGPIENLEKLATELTQKAVIVENGLFLRLATKVIVAGRGGIELLTQN